MKDIIGVIVGIILAVALILGVVAYQHSQQPKNAGSLYIGVTDAAADMQGVADIGLNVSKIELHSAAQGWVTVSSNSKIYNLLSLRNSGKTALHAKEKVSAGSYDMIRVSIGNVNVKMTDNTSMDASLPSSQITANTMISIAKGKDSYVKIDFLADKSLHSTTDKNYVFAPVIAVESRSNADVTVDADEAITATGGTIDSSVNVGVDLNGASKNDFKLDTSAGLHVESAVNGAINFILGNKTYTNTQEKMDTTNDSTNGGDMNDKNTSSAQTSIEVNATSDTNANTNTNSNGGNTNTNGNVNLKLGY